MKMKNVRIISILLTFIVVFVSAELKIVYPSKDYYLVAGAPDQVIWTYEAGDPATFSIFLTNPKIVDLKQYALANNVATKVGKINVEINPNFVGTGFQIMFTNIGNITQSYATSDPFEIKEQGTEPTVYVTPTPSATSTNNSTENGNTKANSSNSIHGYGFGILVLITLITMISFN